MSSEIRVAARHAIHKAQIAASKLGGMRAGTPGFGVYEIVSTPPGRDREIVCVHVVPEYGPPHTMVGDTCQCRPSIEWFPSGNALVVHAHLSVAR